MISILALVISPYQVTQQGDTCQWLGLHSGQVSVVRAEPEVGWTQSIAAQSLGWALLAQAELGKVPPPPPPAVQASFCPPSSSILFLQFSQQEEKRQKAERLQQQQKHENQMRDMVAQCESNMSELQQLQVRSPVSQFPQVSAQRPPAE